MRVVSVSNRLPDGPGQYKGGLAVGVMQSMAANGGLWIGWHGEVDTPARSWMDGDVEFQSVHMTRTEYEQFYVGFCSSTLYPLVHEMTDYFHFDAVELGAWHSIQERFAKKVASLIEPDDVVIVHDVPVLGVARRLRQMGLENRLIYFQHGPFPGRRMRRLLPLDIKDELLQYDAACFHTGEDAASYGQDNGHVVPLGIDAVYTRGFRSTLPIDKGTILGVDRLDYTKGVLQRFEAFDRASATRELRYHQVSPPTRMDTPGYMAFSAQACERARQLSRRYPGQFKFDNRYLPHDLILELMSESSIFLATSLRDGMGLTVHEYIAAQNPKDPGVPIVSKLMGAAAYFPNALLVDPWDIDSIVKAIHRAASMGKSERIERHKSNLEMVSDLNCTRWVAKLLACVERKQTI